MRGHTCPRVEGGAAGRPKGRPRTADAKARRKARRKMGGGQSPGTGGEPPQRGGMMAAHKHIADGQDPARADARSRGGGRAHGVG